MPNLTAGQSATIDIPAGMPCYVSTTQDAYVDLVAGAPGSGYTSDRLVGGRAGKLYGPWTTPAKITIRSALGTATYGGAYAADPIDLGQKSAAAIVAINAAIAAGTASYPAASTVVNTDTGARWTLSGLGTAGAFAVDGDGNSGKLQAVVHTTIPFSALTAVDNSVNNITYLNGFMLPVEYSAVQIGVIHLGGSGAVAGYKFLVGSTDDIGTLGYVPSSTEDRKFVTPWKGGTQQGAISGDGWQQGTFAGATSVNIADPGAENITVTWSDVINVQGIPLAYNDPTNKFVGMYPLLVRVHPGTSFYTKAGKTGLTDPALYVAEAGPQLFVCAHRGAVDAVTTPGGWTNGNTPVFDTAADPMAIIVVAYGNAAAKSHMLVGDSRIDGATLADQPTASYRNTIFYTGKAWRDAGKVVQMVAAAQAGKTTAQYFARAMKYLAKGDQPPTYATYLAYSINDGGGSAGQFAAAKARVLQFIARCSQLNIKPSFVSLFPTGTGYVGANLTRARAFDDWVASLGYPYISPLQIYGDSLGGWLPGWAYDADHMVQAGYVDLGARIAAMVNNT